MNDRDDGPGTGQPRGRGGGCGGGGRGGGAGGGLGGGRGSLLEPAILAALIGAQAHGYDLRASVETFTCGFLTVDPGGLYRALRRMEDDGLVASAWAEGEHGPQRRVYRITDDGLDVLDAWRDRLVARRDAIDGLLGAIGAIDANNTADASNTAQPGRGRTPGHGRNTDPTAHEEDDDDAR